jgi:hypothetical protein
MNACASRGRSRETMHWPALVPADLYLDARRPEWAVYEACGRIKFQRWGRYGELPKVSVGAGLPEVVEVLEAGATMVNSLGGKVCSVTSGDPDAAPPSPTSGSRFPRGTTS